MAKIYFDNNATTFKSQAVINAIVEISHLPLNASSIHSFGRKAKLLMEEARARIRAAFFVPKNFRIIFTGSATEANNLILQSAEKNSMLIFTPKTEHPSVLKAKANHHISVNENGEVNIDEINAKGFYSIMMANNETGVIQPMSEIVEQIRAVNGLLHIDAVQAIGKIPFNCSDIGASAYTISGHKFGGPYGVGCLIYNPNVISLKSLMFGGGQEYGLRPGTENIVAIHGVGVAVTEIDERVKKMQEHILPIRDFIEKQISDHCKSVRIFGKNAQQRLPNTISITMPGVKSELQVVHFDSHGIAVSAGAACSAGRVDFPHVQTEMNSSYEEASCALRISLGVDNTMEEAEFFIQKWKELYDRHRNG